MPATYVHLSGRETDVPLLAANLKLALASVETMLRYGVMNDWLTAVSLNEENKIVKTIEVKNNKKENKRR